MVDLCFDLCCIFLLVSARVNLSEGSLSDHRMSVFLCVRRQLTITTTHHYHVHRLAVSMAAGSCVVDNRARAVCVVPSRREQECSFEASSGPVRCHLSVAPLHQFVSEDAHSRHGMVAANTVSAAVLPPSATTSNSRFVHYNSCHPKSV